MFSEIGDLTRLFLFALAGLIIIVGITACLGFGALVQTRRLIPSLPAIRRLKHTPFTMLHVQVAMAVTLFFALTAALQTPTEEAPPEHALVIGPLLYAALTTAVILFGLFYSRVSFRRAFLGQRGSGWIAFKKGLLYGIVAIPPVIAISVCVNAALEAFGITPQQQAVFDWLTDDTMSLGIRLFLVASAVLIAPISEELLFRGILFNVLLKKRSFIFAALLSGIYFALVHLHMPTFLPLLALSVAFSAGYAATGSIITSIVMHTLFNLSSLIFYFSGPP